MIANQRIEYAMNLLLSEFELPLESGTFDFNFSYKGLIYEGPIFVKTRKKYYEHSIKCPITNKVYWISTLNKGMYRLYKNESSNSFFALSDSSTEIWIPENELDKFKSSFINSIQCQAIICLLFYCIKTCSIKSITGDVFKELFNQYDNENGEVTINVTWFKTKNQNNPNIININLF